MSRDAYANMVKDSKYADNKELLIIPGASQKDIYDGGEKDAIPFDKLESFYRANKVLLGIITVPTQYAQEVCDQLIACGIKAVWNFAPTHLEVPEHILVQNENMATSLAVLSMHLQAQMKEQR